MNKERIKASIETLYGDVINNGKADLLPGLVAGPYIQHDPLFTNGIEPLMGYLHSKWVYSGCEIKRLAIEAKTLALIQVRFPNWGGSEHAAVEIFRFDAESRILEHWSVMQPVPEQTANPNTMF